MDGGQFYDCLRRLVGDESASAYARRFGNLDQKFYGDLLNYEALAFFTYSTGLTWHEMINGELWSAKPGSDVSLFSDVLNAALAKLPRYSANGGMVYRGLRINNLDNFLKPYTPGQTVLFRGFTSAAFEERSAFGGNVLFIIRALTARVIWYVCAHFDEFEVLIPAGRAFRVISIDRRADRAVITLEELP